MSNPLHNFQEYFREIEAGMEGLRAAVRGRDEASRPQPPASEASAIGDIPVMHFQGLAEQPTLTRGFLSFMSRGGDGAKISRKSVINFLRDHKQTVTKVNNGVATRLKFSDNKSLTIRRQITALGAIGIQGMK